jgi:hypothetical protein
VDYNSLDDLNKELESALINWQSRHAKMEQLRTYYQNSVYYAPKNGAAKPKADLRNNMLRVYADKNIHFTSPFPTMKVPTPGATPEERQAASMREKIILAVHRVNNTPLLQKKWAFDSSVMIHAIAETSFDFKSRCVTIKRYDPRYVLWQVSNGNSHSVTAFWAVYPITADEAKKKYGVTPTNQPIATTALTDQYLKAIDGKDWFLHAIRWDENVRVSWIGDQLVEEPHNHQLGVIPVDVVTPFDEADENGYGASYLDPMIPLQAELNYTIARRSKIVDRMASPTIWGRNIVGKQFDEVKKGLSSGSGGFVGLKQQGELGVLQVNDVNMLQEHEESIRRDMQRLSGFSDASMGELAGANTSGDALSMYFTPTQRHIEHQYISWTAFYQSINAKILRFYDKFLQIGEQITLDGYAPASTVVTMSTGDPHYSKSGGGFSVTFDKSVINGNYSSIVIPKAVTPKNELEEKRLVMEAVAGKFLSHTTGFEMIGIESPEDELALLTQEQSDPALNPQGVQQMMQAAQTLQQPQAEGIPANVQPAPVSSN